MMVLEERTSVFVSIRKVGSVPCVAKAKIGAFYASATLVISTSGLITPRCRPSLASRPCDQGAYFKLYDFLRIICTPADSGPYKPILLATMIYPGLRSSSEESCGLSKDVQTWRSAGRDHGSRNCMVLRSQVRKNGGTGYCIRKGLKVRL
jgi:hypothetical protein